MMLCEKWDHVKAMGKKGAACKSSDEWYLALILYNCIFKEAGQSMCVSFKALNVCLAIFMISV